MTPLPAFTLSNMDHRSALLFAALSAVLLFGLAFQHPSDAAPPLDSVSLPDAASPPASISHADTMTVQVEAGQPLITDLPSRYGGRPIRAYRIARAPALASVAGESLLWVTRPGDKGQHDIALLAQTVNAPADTVWVRVNVTPPE